jgi:outer membrane autotransporter protein
LNSGTAGLDFQTKGGVGLGAMVNYGSTSGHTDFPGHITDDADNFGLTLSAIKNFDWFFIGLSGGYDNNDTLMVTPVGNRLKTYADSYTLAPFIGAMYVKGNFSFSVAPTLVLRWQEFGYNVNGVGTPGDDSSDVTFVLMSKVSYNVTEKLALALLANWSCVVDENRSKAAVAQPEADNNWFTVGPKVSFQFTDKLSAYASYTIDLGTRTYDNQQVTAGLTFNF